MKLVRVEDDPFAATPSGKGTRLEPVDHDPFAASAAGNPFDQFDDVTLTGRAREAGKGFVRGARDIGASTIKGMVELMNPLEAALSRRKQPLPVTTSPLYQFGRHIGETGADTLAADPQYAELFTTKLGEGLGAFAGIAAATAIAPQTLPARLAVGVGVGALASGAEGAQEAREAGSTEEDVLKTFLLYAGVGTTEALPVTRFLNRMSPQVKHKVLGILKQGLTGAAEEGSQEVGQQLLNNLIASKVVGYDPERNLFSGTKESGEVGGAVGFILNTVAASIGSRRGRGRTETQEPPPVPAEAATVTGEQPVVPEAGGAPLPRDVAAQRRHQQAKKLNPERDDLETAVRKLGGIRDDQGHGLKTLTEGAKSSFFGPLVTRKGRTLSEMTERLYEEGYLTEYDERQVMDLLSDSVAGRKAYSIRYDYDTDPAGILPDLLNQRGSVTVPRVSPTARNLSRAAVDIIGGQAITRVRRLGKVSPSFRYLANVMEADPESSVPVSAAHFERVSRTTGKYMLRLQDALDDLAGKFTGRVPKQVNDRLVAALRGEKPADARTTRAALRIRKLLNDVRKDLLATGVNVGFVPNYFPRLYSKKVLSTEEGRVGLSAVFQRHGIEPDTANRIVHKITTADGLLDLERVAGEKLDGTRGGRITPDNYGDRIHSEGRARRNKNLELARTLVQIPERELRPFLENNAYGVLSRYIEYAAARAEMARSFGANEGRLNNMVRQGIRETLASGNQDAIEELDSGVRRVYDLVDAMQKSYRRIENPALAKANTFMVAYQYLRTLPFATLSSLSEPFIILERGRLDTTVQAIPNTLRHLARGAVRSLYKGVAKAEATRAAEEAGLALDVALSERLTASFGGETTKFTEAFFKLTFLHQFTRFNRVLAFESGKNMVTGHLNGLAAGAKGLRGKRYVRELTELGIDPAEGIAWIRRGARESDPFFENVVNAGIRFTNDVVMAPRATVRPMWHSNPHYHLVSQLKGFQTVFGNTVLPRWYRKIARRGAYEGTRNATNLAAVGALMVFAAMLGNELREWIKYGPGGNPRFRKEDPLKTVGRAMDRAGFFGAGQFLIDAAYAHRWGSSGPSQLLGPAASQAGDVFKAVGEVTRGNTRPLARATAEAIPLINALPEARKAVADELGPVER